MLDGCAIKQAGSQTEYYLLSSNSPQSHNNGNYPAIGINPVHVASYIDNQGIALQTIDNRIHIANQHLWADSPSKAITRVIYSELVSGLQNFNVENNLLAHTEQQLQLSIQVDQFHGTERGLAIFSGYWQLEQDNKILTNTRFNLQKKLEGQGYNALVQALRSLLNQLAQQQISYIENLTKPVEVKK